MVLGCGQSTDNPKNTQIVQVENIIQDPKVLISVWHELNSQCRGGSGDSPKTWEACDARSRVDKVLDKMNWCYGKEQEYAYQAKWHKCGRDSLRLGN